jgi:uncharacterized protein YndB with AHSA1/START domain
MEWIMPHHWKVGDLASGPGISSLDGTGTASPVWGGPNGFTNTFHTFDLRPEGTWEYTMHGPDGQDYPNRNVFQEIGPERIVLRHETGHHFIMTATFMDVDGGTEVTFRQTLASKENYKKRILPNSFFV